MPGNCHEHRSLRISASRFGEERAPFLSPRRVAELLGVNMTELARLTGLARNTLAAKPGARMVDAALSPIVRILAMAGEMAGDEHRAAIWFKHQPIPGWAGKTAYDLVREGKTDKVLAYLEAVRSGIYA
ncbi:MbcA/ParS/Xre antitoxin family protein [Mesorhizobium sp. M0598]|uniref:antitoxin Xre/MbcA/ParS toxin-binding domain-containing protein n=1 Tax=Mesorhizobium sp. M0598 TaxID=2956968 RepID=UPI00333A2456